MISWQIISGLDLFITVFFPLDHDNLEKDAVHKKRSSNHKSHYDSLSDSRLL